MVKEDCHRDTSYCIHDPGVDIYGGRCYDPIMDTFQQYSVPTYNLPSFEHIETDKTDDIECAYYCKDVSAYYNAFSFDEGNCR